MESDAILNEEHCGEEKLNKNYLEVVEHQLC